MTTSKDLLLAILAMDSYNRGYGAGLTVSGTQIGSATIGLTSTDPAANIPNGKSSGFYAAAYTIGAGVDGISSGSTVIAYRGTNFDVKTQLLLDVLYGWPVAVGVSSDTQAKLALDFYKAATNHSVNDGALSNVYLTGHSLGGGLAGYASALSGTEAIGYDSMSFGTAAWIHYATDPTRALSNLPNFSNYSGINTQGEILTYVRNGGAVAAESLLALALTGNPFVSLATAVAALAAERYNQTVLPVSGVSNPVTLHSMALLTLLQFAKDTTLDNIAGNEIVDWVSIQDVLVPEFFDHELAHAVGFAPSSASAAYSEEAKMLSALAYSTLEGAQGLVFGNTGARALFDDADQLGGLKTAGKLTSHLSDELSDLAKIVMQFSGLMAKNKVNAANHTDLKPELGVLSVSSAGAAVAAGGYAAADTLFVDLSQARWTESDTGTAQPKVKIIGVRANEIIVGGAGNDNRLPERLAA